jgi:hypothetical protein
MECNMAKRYFSLLERDSAESPWAVQFGDYDRETVESERDEMIDRGIKRRNLRIIETGSKQADIFAAVAKLNAPLVAPVAEAAPVDDSPAAQHQAEAQSRLPAFRIDRCKHPNAGGIALWVFAADVQVGSMTLFDGASVWKANRMWRGMPISERRFASLADACEHIAGAAPIAGREG